MPGQGRAVPGPAEPERLQRALARAGFGSRRVGEDLIRDGRVRVNGRPATLGDRVDPSRDEITVDGVPVAADPELRYLALNKPAGVTTTLADTHAARTVAEFIPAGPRLFPVGRLDRESEGLLLLTNDGRLAHRIQHPRYGVEKEYLAEVNGVAGPSVAHRLVRGVDLDDGRATAVRARLVSGGAGRSAVRIVMVEGRKREVRRMLEALGHPVSQLVRVRLGPLRLGRLRPGEVRTLTPEEVRELYAAAEPARPKRAPQRDRPARPARRRPST
jgi:23S rRNA pseudouridine2605 synthase